MAESNWKTEGYDPSKHGFWKATLDDRGDLGYPNRCFGSGNKLYSTRLPWHSWCNRDHSKDT